MEKRERDSSDWNNKAIFYYIQRKSLEMDFWGVKATRMDFFLSVTLPFVTHYRNLNSCSLTENTRGT